MRIGDDRRVDVGMAIEVELLELERHAVVRIQIVEPPADVRARGDRRQLEAGMAHQQPRASSAPVYPAAPNTATLGVTDPPAELAARAPRRSARWRGDLGVGQRAIGRPVGEPHRERHVARPERARRRGRRRTPRRRRAAARRRRGRRRAPAAALTALGDDHGEVLAHVGEARQILGTARSAARGTTSKSSSNAATASSRSHCAATSGWISPTQPTGVAAGDDRSRRRPGCRNGSGCSGRAPSTETRSVSSSRREHALGREEVGIRRRVGSRQRRAADRARSAARRGGRARAAARRRSPVAAGTRRRPRTAAPSPAPWERLRARDVEQRAEQRRAQLRLLARHRVREHDGSARSGSRRRRPGRDR